MGFKQILSGTSKFLSSLCLLFFFNCSSTQNTNWYYAWQNTYNKLESSPDIETIPTLINGKNYRILRINNLNGKIFKGFSYKSNNSKLKIFQLPLMEDHANNKIFDLVLPLRSGDSFQETQQDKFFLITFEGSRSGQETVNFSLETDRQSYKYSKVIKTANQTYSPSINLNVFAYFDYNFLVKGLKTKVIQDLTDHHTDVLVIPPAVLPKPDQSTFNTEPLRNYLNGTENKFKYYILYFNFNDSKIDMNSITTKKSIPGWYKSMMNVFEDYKISKDRVLLFPYDEPKNDQISQLSRMYDSFRASGITNPFFVTIDDQNAAKSLGNKIEFIQMKPEVLSSFNTRNSKSEIWTYELIYGSRDRNATEYRNMSTTAFKNNAKGIGVWSYADVDRSVGQKGVNDFSRGIGTWDINYDAPSAEYSLIYRKGNEIYPSLRWEALSYGLEDYFWLEMYRKKFGINESEKLLKNIELMSEKEREDIKLKTIN